jgi:hypothetical protein
MASFHPSIPMGKDLPMMLRDSDPPMNSLPVLVLDVPMYEEQVGA